MKKLINILATVVLATSSVPFLAKQYITTKLQDTPTQYQQVKQHYNVGEDPNPSTGEEYSKTFQTWINGNGLHPDSSWDSYLHQFNESGNTEGLNPVKARVGGGIFLNQSEQNGPFLPQYANDNAHGSFAYKSYKNTPPTEGTGERNFEVNNLNPNTDPDQKTQTKQKIQKLQNSNVGMNTFIDGYLTAILNYWYYTQFGSDIEASMDPNDYALKQKEYTDFYNNVLFKYLDNLLVFEFGAQWNDKEKVKTEVPNYEKIALPFEDLALDAVGAALGPWGWVGSWVAEATLDYILDFALTHYETVDHQFKYVSDPLSISIIQNIFSDILGDDSGSPYPLTSVIKEFLDKNGVLPDHLTLKNFNFNVHNYTANNQNDSSNINTTQITPNISFDIAADKASPSYAQQKGEIDDPNIGDRDFPEQIYTGGKSITSTKEWNEDGIDTALNSAWSFGDFEQYVSYEPTPLIFGQLTLVKMYCPLLGWTKDNPRYFYVQTY